MLKVAEVSSSDVVYDLGCGDGIIVATAAQKFGATAVGIDIDPAAGQGGDGSDPESERRPTR